MLGGLLAPPSSPANVRSSRPDRRESAARQRVARPGAGARARRRAGVSDAFGRQRRPLRSLAGVERSGPLDAIVRCAGRWAPIQAKVSGFVVGNCRGGTPIRIIALDICAPGCQRGAANEGRGWAAFSPPDGGRYRSCGWINVRNRSAPARATDRAPASRCARREGPDVALPQRFIKRDTGRAWARPRRPPPSPTAGSTSGPADSTRRAPGSRGRRDPLSTAPRGGPHLPGVRERRSHPPWRSRRGEGAHVDRPRWLSPRADPVRSPGTGRGMRRAPAVVGERPRTAPTDRDRPWGFVSAECLFAGDRRAGRDHSAPAPRASVLRRIARHPVRPGAERCGFAPVGFHRIVAVHGLGCSGRQGGPARASGPT